MVIAFLIWKRYYTEVQSVYLSPNPFSAESQPFIADVLSNISWSRFCSFAERDFASFKIFLVMRKVLMVWNAERAALRPCARTFVSLSQFQAPCDDVSWGYAFGDTMASKKVISSTSKRMYLSTHLHSPCNLLWDDTDINFITVT